jgi:hypothetical protein
VEGVQFGLKITFDLAGVVYGELTRRSPVHPAHYPLALAFINTVAFGVVICGGLYLTRTPAREVFRLGRLSCGLTAAVVLSLLGPAIVLSEAKSCPGNCRIPAWRSSLPL